MNKPRFFSNWSDDNHCLQASIKMALTHKGKELSWEEINTLTDYEDNLYTWTPRAVVSLSKMLPGINLISPMDYVKFAKEGEKYYKQFLKYHPEVFEEQKRLASPNFLKEQKAAKELIILKLYQNRELNLKEIEKLLSTNLLVALVDPGGLEGHPNYKGHFVLIYNQTENHFHLHDPGLPPRKALKITKKRFIESYRGHLIVIPRSNFLKKAPKN